MAKETLIRTAGAPVGIKLNVDRDSIAADGDDMAFVTVEIIDNEGNLHSRLFGGTRRLTTEARSRLRLTGYPE